MVKDAIPFLIDCNNRSRIMLKSEINIQSAHIKI
jgi:hypothetical protein